MALDVDNSRGELVIDPYKHKEEYLRWDRTIPGVSKENEAAIVRYLEDMRQGRNVNPKAVRGKRGYHRLINQKHRLTMIAQFLSAHEGISFMAPTTLPEIKALEPAAARLFSKMEDGLIRRRGGGRYLAVMDYIKAFKAFWHWHMVAEKRERDVVIPDITEYLTVRDNRKPSFVYFGEPGRMDVEQGFRRLYDHAKYDHKALIAFMFDAGIRCPTELMNVKQKDITPIPGTPFYYLQIRDETSKTFGRRIKLMHCHDQLRTYLSEHSLAPSDFVFRITPNKFNQYLKRLGERALGKPDITMYDFRHNSVCYFVPRYKNENALMYRFGWKDSAMIHYYSEFLGMKDTLQEDDFLLDRPKTQLERDLAHEQKQRMQLDDELQQMRAQMGRVNALMNALTADPETLDILARKARSLKEAKILLETPD